MPSRRIAVTLQDISRDFGHIVDAGIASGRSASVSVCDCSSALPPAYVTLYVWFSKPAERCATVCSACCRTTTLQPFICLTTVKIRSKNSILQEVFCLASRRPLMRPVLLFAPLGGFDTLVMLIVRGAKSRYRRYSPALVLPCRDLDTGPSDGCSQRGRRPSPMPARLHFARSSTFTILRSDDICLWPLRIRCYAAQNVHPRPRRGGASPSLVKVAAPAHGYLQSTDDKGPVHPVAS